MPNGTSCTPEEVAKKLKISKYTVYELIKRGELAAYRVGRKVRVEETDIESYKQRSKSSPLHSAATPLPAANSPPTSASFVEVPLEDDLVICGQDIILDILTRYLVKQFSNIKFLRNYVGSIDGLTALYRGQANAVAVHLWDSDADDYNLPYVRFINRERGSGARVLLDEKLRIESIPHHLINGYYDEGMSHMAIASKVARGEADVGLGIEKTALQVPNIDFIPLQKERYDLVIRQEDLNKRHFQALLGILRSHAYQCEVEGLGGYDISQMGEIVQ